MNKEIESQGLWWSRGQTMKEDWAWVFKILLEEVLIIEIFEKYTFIFTLCFVGFVFWLELPCLFSVQCFKTKTSLILVN